MKLHYYPLITKFKDPFTISGGRTKSEQSTLIVSLSLGNYTGWGEAPAISYYDISVEQMLADLKDKKMFVEKFALTEPERYWHYLHHLFPKNPFLVCALDMACWDLFGQLKGRPLYQLWETTWNENNPLTDYTIGLDTVDNMIRKIKTTPWPVYKIKLGSPDDIANIKALRAVTDAPLRVDVNGGWTLDEALEKIPQLKKLGVTFIEQPLPRAQQPSDWTDMKTLYEASALPLIADESCVSEFDVEKCKGYFHGINIKLTKCSGPTPALRMIRQARDLGLMVMMGSMNETAIGSAAIAHFLPQLDAVDMDGILLLERPGATGLSIEKGVVSVSGAPGLGIRPDFSMPDQQY